MKQIFTFFNLRRALMPFAFIMAVVCGTNAYAQPSTTYHRMQFAPGYGLKNDVIVEDTFDLASQPGNPYLPMISPAVWADTTFTQWFPPAPPTQVTKAFLFTAESMYAITGAQASNPGGPMYGFFPNNRVITSNQFGSGGPDYMMEPYDGNNALRLQGFDSDTLRFTNTSLTGDVYILGTASGGNQSVFIHVLYTDGTFHTHYVMFPNFVNGADYAMEVGIIQNSSPWLQSTGLSTDSDPRIYDRRLKLPAADYNKQIEGIAITKSGSVGTVLNIFAVTIADNDCVPIEVLPLPTNLTTTTANFSWSPITGSIGYEYELKESPTNLTALTPQGAGGFQTQTGVTASPFINFTGLTPNTQYILYVRSLCSTTDTSIWISREFTTPDCLTPPTYSINYNTTNPNYRTTTSIDVKWIKFLSQNFQSPNVVTWEYGINTDPTTPPTVLYTSTALDTTHNFTGLLTDQQYCFWIRNYCTNTSYSPWQKNCNLSTQPCPAISLIHLDSSTHMPGSARFWWNVVNDGAVVGYEYALMPTTGVPSAGDWVKTTDTFVHFTNLNPGQYYRLYVRTDCNNVTAIQRLFSYQNPYYECFAPGNPVISNININGAQIDWPRGNSAAPYPLLGYNISVSPLSSAPFQDSGMVSDYLGMPFPKFFYRPDTFAHPSQLTPNTKYYVHVRTYCDSVLTPGQPGADPFYPRHMYSTPDYAWEVDTFTTPATCQAPVIPTISNLTASTADFLWNPYYGTDGYEYYIDEYPTAPPANKVAYITYHQLNALNLFSNTNYWLHLRTICDYSQSDSSLRHSPWTHTPFQTPALCSSAVPTPSFVSNTGVTASFSWAPTGSGINYDVAVTQSSTAPGAPDATVSTTTYKALNLTPNSNYYFHVRSRCSPNDASIWASIPFTTNATSIETFNNNLAVVVYPNPVSDELIVDIQNNPNGIIQVFDVTGKLMHTVKTTTQKTGINMKHYAAGIYLVKYLVDGQTLQTIRVEKM